MGAFTPAEHDDDPHLVPSLEEAADVVHFREEIMILPIYPELDGFLFLLPAAFPCVLGLLLHLVAVLAVIEQFRNGRLGGFADQDEIQVNFTSTPDGFAGIDDALLLAIGSDEPYLSDEIGR